MHKAIKILISIILVGLFIFPIEAFITNFKDNAMQGIAESLFLIIFESTLYFKIKNEQKNE